MNYIGGQNPFNLATPPAWFLQQLAFRDPDLVILPGMSEPVYRLARRVRNSMGLVRAVLGHDSETARMIKHRLIPVTSIMPFVTWGPQVFQWLDERDVWAVGGAAKADGLIAENESIARQQLLKREAADADAVGSAGWMALKMRAGSTVMHNGQRRFGSSA